MENPDFTLSGDDAMAHNFLRRAADAIVSASSLSIELAEVRRTAECLHETLDVMEDTKRSQETRIAELEDALARVKGERDNLQHETARLDSLVRARQSDIDVLDTKVAGLEAEINDMTTDRDRWKAKSELQAEALNTTVDKLNAIHAVLGKPPLDPDPREEIEAACSPSPSSEPFETPRTDEGWTPEYEHEDKLSQNPNHVGYFAPDPPDPRY